MKEIIVKSQAEFDALPIDFDGRIIIKFGTPWNRAVINRKFKYPVVLYGSSSAVLRGSSSAELYDLSSAELRGSSSAVLYDSSSAELYDLSSAVLYGSSSAVLRGNSQAVDGCRRGNIETHGNSRIVHNPTNIDEYIEFHGIETEGEKVKLYKAVHFDGTRYFADADYRFTYPIGETVKPTNGFDNDPHNECGAGIHMAHKAWAVDYGRGWNDLAILELEVDKSDIVVPLYGSGKVRARKAKVLREAPLEECGLLGKMLAKKKAVE